MTGEHLLSIAIGPVQEFIAQARRTRDLWYGSHLLSELSRTAAQAASSGRGTPIFPPFESNHPELRPCDGPVRPAGERPAAVANRILAVVESEQDARQLAAAARAAVDCRWRAIAEKVRTRMARAGVLAEGIDDVWNEQIEDFIEFYAAWTPVGGDYGKARRKVESALASRKALRDFGPWQHDRAGAPKSSLDGARVSVLREKRNTKAYRRLRIGRGEQLDAVGLCKRAGGSPEQFVPLPNVTAAAWLRGASETAPKELSDLRQACEEIELGRIHRKDLPVAELFPFDASILYPSRWSALFEEMGAENGQDLVKWGEDHVRPLLRSAGGEPPSYVACLVADGDHMGAALDELAGGKEPVAASRKFSERLLTFPAEASQIVSGHIGAPVYAGGDDVLAFLPVATALDCAKDLAEAFGRAMEQTDVETKPTLSVGIGIAHVVESMGLLLELGREAERKAKDSGRDALAIVFDKRSGGRRTWSCQWSDSPVDRLRRDAGLFESKLSSGKVYEAGALLRRFPSSGDPALPCGAAEALVAYMKQVFAHSDRGGMTAGDMAEAGLIPVGTLRPPSYRETCERLGSGLERLLLARDLRSNGFDRRLSRAETA